MIIIEMMFAIPLIFILLIISSIDSSARAKEIERKRFNKEQLRVQKETRRAFTKTAKQKKIKKIAVKELSKLDISISRSLPEKKI
jgi:thymidylate kinase